MISEFKILGYWFKTHEFEVRSFGLLNSWVFGLRAHGFLAFGLLGFRYLGSWVFGFWAHGFSVLGIGLLVPGFWDFRAPQ